VDYDFDPLGTRNFEHLVQSLASKYVGQAVSIFGDGGDGGREATWDGPLSPDTRLPNEWNGFGVIQAKFKLKNTHDPSDNAKWLKSELHEELARWADPDSGRRKLPEYLLLVTNVTLSPGNGGGIEQVEEAVTSNLHDLGLSTVKGFAVWHRDSLRVLLDSAEEIRRSYAAWITPGDLINAVLDALGEPQTELEDAVASYTAKTMRDGSSLNLTQAGSVNDQGLRIDQVFIDLPVSGSSTAATESIIQAANAKRVRTSEKQDLAPHLVLVGGPGQGKSTVTQFLTQLYRAHFLEGNPASEEPEIAELIEAISGRASDRSVSVPKGRRWPMRVILTDYADQLAEGSVTNLFDYIATEISRVSGYQVAAQGIRTWIRNFPWLLLLDGLDEVPATSNRAETINTVNDFLLDAANLRADVFVLVTTRPQGYGDEFASLKFNRIDLAPLPSELALEYVLQLTELRIGVDSDRFRNVARRLRAAALEPETSRLMSTPLQATILSLLVERQGQAPKDRWRLFSQYYRVIFQREQEKGGELAEILSQYETDIHAVHYAAGFVLQARAEGAGETESMLSEAELDELLAARLREQGHPPERATDLAVSIRAVTTDRLVFLAALRDTTYGFEIRSLQEFMAGEQIFTAPADRVITSLRDIALSAHWSNVLMFAIGKIFAEREQHRTDVIALCDLLNSEHRTFEVARPGSVLALRVLDEGVAKSTPMFAQLLASCAAQLASAGPDMEIPKLGRAVRMKIADIDELEDRAGTNTFAALQLIAESADASPESALPLDEFVNAAADDPELAIRIVRFASAQMSPSLARAATRLALTQDPYHVLAAERLASVSHSRAVDNDEALPNVFEIVRDLIETGSDDEITVAVRESPQLAVSFKGLAGDESPLKALATLESSHPGWQIIGAIADFATNPSRQSLESVLQHSPPWNDRLVKRVARSAPWPLSHREQASDWFQRKAEELTDEPINRVWDRAQIGDFDQWGSAEASWKTQSIAENLEAVWRSTEHAEQDLPTVLSSLFVGDELSAIAPRMQLGGDGPTKQRNEWQRQNLERLRNVSASPMKSALARLLLWDLSGPYHWDPDEETAGDDGRPSLSIGQLLEAAEDASVASWADLMWVDKYESDIDLEDEPTVAALLRICRSPVIAPPTSTSFRNALSEMVATGAHLWPFARLVFAMGGLLSDLPTPADQDQLDPLRRSVYAAHKLGTTSERLTNAELLSLWEDLVSADGLAIGRDTINAWAVLEHPGFLADISGLDDARLINFAGVIELTRTRDPLWSAESLQVLRMKLESLPSNEFDVPGFHKAMTSRS